MRDNSFIYEIFSYKIKLISRIPWKSKQDINLNENSFNVQCIYSKIFGIV